MDTKNASCLTPVLWARKKMNKNLIQTDLFVIRKSIQFLLHINHTFFARAKKVAKESRPVKSLVPRSLPFFGNRRTHGTVFRSDSLQFFNRKILPNAGLFNGD